MSALELFCCLPPLFLLSTWLFCCLPPLFCCLLDSQTVRLRHKKLQNATNEGYQNLGLFFYGKSFLQIPLFKVQTFFIRGNSPVNLVRSKHTHTWPILAEFFFLSVSKVRKQQCLKILKVHTIWLNMATAENRKICYI